MIQFFLITLGLILTLSGIHQATKPNIHWMDYENQIGFIIVGSIFVFLGLFVLWI
jgi:uncharacterized protein YjeT (DUF2065 family)